jgi:hypothetical protein
MKQNSPSGFQAYQRFFCSVVCFVFCFWMIIFAVVFIHLPCLYFFFFLLFDSGRYVFDQHNRQMDYEIVQMQGSQVVSLGIVSPDMRIQLLQDISWLDGKQPPQVCCRIGDSEMDVLLFD